MSSLLDQWELESKASKGECTSDCDLHLKDNRIIKLIELVRRKDEWLRKIEYEDIDNIAGESADMANAALRLTEEIKL